MRTLLAIVVMFLLAMTGTAIAKSILGGKACGADKCVRFGSAAGGGAVLERGPLASPPEKNVPFYRLRFTVGEGNRAFGYITVVYAPSEARMKSADGSWTKPPPHTLAAFNRLVRGLRPYPAAKMTSVHSSYRLHAPAIGAIPHANHGAEGSRRG